MTTDDIIEIAKYAGMNASSIYTPSMTQFLERFAELVAAAEREACAKVCDGLFELEPSYTNYACAAEDCAKAIRARGQE